MGLLHQAWVRIDWFSQKSRNVQNFLLPSASDVFILPAHEKFIRNEYGRLIIMDGGSTLIVRHEKKTCSNYTAILIPRSFFSQSPFKK